jgi:hypothetical protein
MEGEASCSRTHLSLLYMLLPNSLLRTATTLALVLPLLLS